MELIENKESIEYIKLMKNSKGYNWEIKVIDLNLDLLHEVDEVLRNKYGSKNESSRKT